MPLNSGDRIGSYEIVGPLGKGGMGEVYRAKDLKLGRDVAIKILPAAFAQFPDRLTRFEREAKVLAKLNHPNIATIYTVEESSEGKALVMELVPGAPVQGPLPLSQAIEYGRQIASAVEAAHEQGITHRDLKPGNIMLTPDGVIKVLDFGLAAVAQASPEEEVAEGATLPTLTLSPTRAGTILGTAPYMSPEQAVGRIVDRRSDIFSFGAVVYELIVGQRAFPGATTPDVLEAVVKNDPDWSKLPAGKIEKLLRRCLEKDRKQRLQSIGEARIVLEHPEPDVTTAPSTRTTWLWPATAAALAVGLAIVGVLLWNRSAAGPQTSARLSIPMQPGQELTSYPAITRDGHLIAYAAANGSETSRLYLRDLNSFESREVPGSSGAKQPFFSPDGKKVAFYIPGQLVKAEVAGGAPVKLADAPAAYGGTWTDDDHIVYGPGLSAGLLRIPSSGGAPEALIVPDGGPKGYAYVFPQSAGDGSFRFQVWGQLSGAAILGPKRDWSVVAPSSLGAMVVDSGGAVSRLLVGPSNGEVKAGVLDVGHPGSINADVSVLNDVFHDVETELVPWLATSRNGTAVYALGNPAKSSIAWVDNEGHSEVLPIGQELYREVRLSRDGAKVLIRRNYELWVYDLQRGTKNRLVNPGNGNGNMLSADWSPDGTRVLFSSNRKGNWDIYSQAVDGSTPAQVVVEQPYDQILLSVAPDGTFLYRELQPKTGSDLWVRTPDGKVNPVRVTPYNERSGVFSPGASPKWIAYASDESGRFEVYVQSYPGGANRMAISNGGGDSPRWSPDGKQLFYVSGGAMMSMAVHPDGTFGVSRKLFDVSSYLKGIYSSYDVSPDGKRFLMIHRDEGSVPRQLNVILNWFAELDRLVPLGK